jgi:hypothetical protein
MKVFSTLLLLVAFYGAHSQNTASSDKIVSRLLQRHLSAGTTTGAIIVKVHKKANELHTSLEYSSIPGYELSIDKSVNNQSSNSGEGIPDGYLAYVPIYLYYQDATPVEMPAKVTIETNEKMQVLAKNERVLPKIVVVGYKPVN